MMITRFPGLVGAFMAGLIATLTCLPSALAEVLLPNIFSNHMVLQQAQKNRVWGRAAAGEEVTVSIAQQKHIAKADANGGWQVTLDPLPVGGPYELVIKGTNEIKIDDILVGEVWICSGQSNMQWSVNQANDPDLEKLAAKYPNVRMINFPQVGSQEPIWSHPDRKWQVCTPESVGSFSAVGYYFARQLHQTLNVPVGMINNAWGGSSCEAWVSRPILEADPLYRSMLDNSDAQAKTAEELKGKTDDASKEALKKVQGFLKGQHRPSNIYNGVLKSHIGYGIKGAIWYQGETNAGRAYQYRELFPLMISSWRKEWNQGDFPFYWVQLADFREEKPEPSESDWAELREAQTMTMSKLPKTGEAVIIDIGEGKDIHPKNKVDVGRRLARWALANDYGIKIAYHSPQYKSMEKSGSSIVLTFEHVEGGWRPFDVNVPRGFTIAGADKKFVKADAKIVAGNRIEVSCPDVPEPASVRYAWADNPVCNMYSSVGLPLTPFRTDDWPGITINNK